MSVSSRFLASLLILISICFLIGPHLSSASSPELPSELQPPLKLFNDGQLLEAYALLNQLQNDHSASKEFLFLKAMTKWRMMWLSTYNASDRQEILDLLDKVDQLCLPKLKEDPTSLFYHAASTGLRAQIAATDGDWWKTASLGKRMKNHALDILAKDPDFYPAYYLLGSYNYFADALPGYLKFLRVLVFVPGGDRKEGLKQLQIAFEKGDITESEAGTTLTIINTYYERKFENGKTMCETLLQRYPHSFDIALYKGINLYYLEDFEASVSWLQNLHGQILEYSTKHESNGSIVPVYRPMEREIRYWIARGLIQQKKYEEAREVLSKLASPAVHQPYWLLRGVYLSLAQIDYKMDRPEYALGWITKVLKWQDVKESHDKAKVLKKRKGNVGTFEIDFL